MVNDIFKLLSSVPFFLILVLTILLSLATLSLDAVSINDSSVKSLEKSSTITWLLVSLSLASGICAMAVVQCWKVFLRPRARFHERALRNIFGEQYPKLMELAAPGFPPVGHDRIDSVSKDPERFADQIEFLDSPVEILMSQLAEAAEYALTNPEEYAGLNQKLVGLSEGDVAYSGYGDRKRYFLDKNMQLLHVRLHAMWRFRVRAVSVFVSAAVACTICFVLNAPEIVVLLGTVAAGLFGGVLSWLTRDVVAVVEANRR